MTALLLILPALAQDPASDLDYGAEPAAPGEETEALPAPEGGDAIINGESAAVDDYPMTGGMLMSGTLSFGGHQMELDMFVCSSTLIAPDVVLLAAHCLDDYAFTYGFGEITGKQVYWSREADLTGWDGTHSNPDLPADAVAASAWVVHPDFDLATLGMGLSENYDIALIFLEEPVTGVPYAYLPTADEATQVEAGAEVVVVGWGQQVATDMWESPAPGTYAIKQMGTSSIAEVSAYEFQVGKETADVRKCHGDSGGPTFMQVDTSSSQTVRLVGVTSHAYDETDCNETGGVDTRVDAYLEWIDAEMTARCQDGSRSWCEVEGIIPPPDGSLAEEDGGEDGDSKKGCDALALPGSALLAGLGMLLAGRRRR